MRGEGRELVKGHELKKVKVKTWREGLVQAQDGLNKASTCVSYKLKGGKRS